MAKTSSKKTNNAKKSANTTKARKEAIDSVKNATPVEPKQVSADILIETVIGHISNIMNVVRNIDDRKFSNVTDIIETAIKELEDENKIGRQDPKSKAKRKLLKSTVAYLEDQAYAIDLLNRKF